MAKAERNDTKDSISNPDAMSDREKLHHVLICLGRNPPTIMLDGHVAVAETKIGRAHV